MRRVCETVLIDDLYIGSYRQKSHTGKAQKSGVFRDTTKGLRIPSVSRPSLLLGDPVRDCRLTCHALTSRRNKDLRSLPLVQALSFDIGLFHSDIAEERRVHHGGIVAEHHQIGTFAQFQ